MKTMVRFRFVIWLLVAVMLQGCAAATVIRKQPDFDNDDRQRLMKTFAPEQLARAACDNSPHVF